MFRAGSGEWLYRFLTTASYLRDLNKDLHDSLTMQLLYYSKKTVVVLRKKENLQELRLEKVTLKVNSTSIV